MTSSKYHRRSVLRSLAIGAGALPALSPWKGYFLPDAHAAATGAPRRIVFIDNPNGVQFKDYKTFVGVKGATPSDFTLGRVLAPLQKHKELLTILNMLEFKKPAGYRDSSAHGVGLAMRLTGTVESNPSPGRYTVANPSIDFYLGTKIGRIATPKFPYLGLGVQSQGKTHTYGDDGSRIFQKQDPVPVYSSLFDGLMNPGSAANPNPAAASRLARRKSVLDSVAKRLPAFRATLAKEDQARADAQLQAIRTLEERLADSMTTGGGPAGVCKKPTAVAKVDYMNDKLFPALTRTMSDMIVAAFACDLTRVANLQLYGGDEPNARVGWDPINLPGVSFHSLSHLDPSYEDFLKAKTYITTLIAELVDKLTAIPEAGGTMMDNTLIFVGTECGDNHGHWGMPFYTVGGKNMGVKMNQFMQLGSWDPGTGMEHNRMLVSFLNAMGLPDETYGAELMKGRGPIPGFFV